MDHQAREDGGGVLPLGSGAAHALSRGIVRRIPSIASDSLEGGFDSGPATDHDLTSAADACKPFHTEAAVALLTLAAGLERAYLEVCMGGEGDGIPQLLAVAEQKLDAASGYRHAGTSEADAWQACRDSVDRVAAGMEDKGVPRRQRARRHGHGWWTTGGANLRSDGGAQKRGHGQPRRVQVRVDSFVGWLDRRGTDPGAAGAEADVRPH